MRLVRIGERGGPVWRYRTYPVAAKRDLNLIDAKLNELGANGWELVTSYQHEGYVIFVLKQQIPEKTSQRAQ